jgi:hypothetical protein
MGKYSSGFNRLLTIFFAVILIIQLAYLLIGLASIPVFYQRVSTQTIEPVIYYGEVQISNELVAQMAANRGLSVSQYAIYRIIVNTLAIFVPLGLAILIVWRSKGQWFTLFTAFTILFLAEYVLSEQTLVTRYISVEIFGANAIFWFLVLLYFFLFPNGKPVPRQAAWLVVELVIYHFIIQVGTVLAYVAPGLAQQMHLPNWGDHLYTIPVLINFAIILACQVYRYRRVSSTTERQQTKWFLFGFGLMVALIPVSLYFDGTGKSNILSDLVELVFWMPVYFGIAIAILRYRLFDIDVIIRKTLVYTLLTAALALVFFGGVALLQKLFGSLSGTENSPAAIVLSTLAIAAMVNPLRRRLQDFIDRRFYRKKYNAEQALARFASVARDETDIEELCAELVDVVQETMQPEQMSIWIKPAVHSRPTAAHRQQVSQSSLVENS